MAASTSKSGKSHAKIQTIGLLGGTAMGKLADYIPSAIALGGKIGKLKFNVVYGGGLCGLLGCTITAAKAEGSNVVGVTLPPMSAAFGMTIGIEVKATSLYERTSLMIAYSDAFIALPGGLDVLEHIFSILSWCQLSLHNKPIGLLNVNNYFDGLLGFLDYAVTQRFISPSSRKRLLVASSFEDLFQKLENFVPEIDLEIPLINWKQKPQKRKRKTADLDLDLHL